MPGQKLFVKLFVLFLISIILNKGISQNQCVPVDLRCEFLSNPIGLDTDQPRLNWRLEDKRPGAKQTAYQIFIGTDSLLIKKGQSNIFQSLKNNSDVQNFIYSGNKLVPFTKYYWNVKIWDKDGKEFTSAINYFETGMMHMSNWKGAWISDTRDISKKEAPYFRTTFPIVKKIISARAYIAAAGLYELYINGNKIGDHVLDPMYTRYDRRNLYVTYDVTKELKSGTNALGILLGNGWYNHQSTAVWYFHEAPWRARPTFCLDLRITYNDGSTEIISSGKNWKTALSPVIFNSIYTAEHYDARLEQTGWNTPEFEDKTWKNVMLRSNPSQNIVAQNMVPVRHVETIPAKSLTKLNDTTYVFDLGRNISGVSRIRLDGPAGTIFRLKHSERLYADGKADLSNIDAHYRPVGNADPFQTDIYILNGKGPQSFSPRFNYKGFQYIEVTSSKPFSLKKEDLIGYFMHSDVAPVGTINCSNQTINKIWSATNNSYLSNLFGYPTDCPQREKNGWTGDAQIAIETGLYNFDGITVYEKWLADHRDEQQPNGVLPSIIPSNGWGYEWGNGPDWTSTIAIIPWNIYLFYGDDKILKDNYEHIKKYVDYITSISPEGLTYWGLGDWVPVRSKAPVELTSSCYYYADALILSKIAKLSGIQSDADKYELLSLKIKDAINKKYLNVTTAIYGNGLQTELAVPLFWGVAPDNLKHKIAENLAEKIRADDNHLDVGLLGTKAILSALSENGFPEVAYTLSAQETFPSWGWWIKNGATTLYENWPIDAKSDISMNHIMFGEIGAWLFKGIGGIYPDPQYPGFKNILIRPNFIEKLDHFSANHTGPYGEIISTWVRSRGGLFYRVIIPPNSSATITFPELNGKKIFYGGSILTDTTINVPAGKYEFEIR